MIRLTDILNETAGKPSEDAIADAIVKIDKVAKQFGFKPNRKFNPKPGKRMVRHADWLPKTAVGPKSDSMLFLYTDANGFHAAWRTITDPYNYNYGKPEEWFDIKKWKSVFGEKSESLN